MSFERLPTELQLAIVQQAPKNALPTLATVSHCLHRCVTPELYSFVKLEDRNCEGTFISKNDHQLVWQSVFGRQPQPSTTIISPDLFLRTLSNSTALRAQVMAATLLWDDDYNYNIFYQLLYLLAPSIQFLQIFPPIPLLSTVCSAPITILEINLHYFDEGYSYSRVGRNKLYSFFAIPTLKALSLGKIESWDCLGGEAPSTRARTSNVICLTIIGSVPAGRDLAEVLTWPKSLRSLCLKLSEDQWSVASSGPHTNLAPFRFIDVLRLHNESLEELVISDGLNWPSVAEEGTGDLRGFPKLRRVGLPRRFMVRSQKSMKAVELQKEDVRDIFETLPPALEELHIELPSEDHWTTVRGMPEQPSELSNWLCGIALNKPNYPALEKIVLWQLPWHMVDCDLGTVPQCADLLAAMKTAKIQLCWSKGQLPFGD